MFCRTCSNEVNNEAVICVKCGVPPLSGIDFCSSCGAKTNPQAIICISCGVSTKYKKKITVNENLEEVLKRPTFWAALLLLISFFLPWLDDLTFSVSGWEMRDLVRLIRLEDEDFRANNLIYTIYFIPILSLIIIFSHFTENVFIHKRLKSWKILSGLYPWLFFILLLNVGNRFSDYIAYGFILTLIASSYLLYDAFANNKVGSPKKKLSINTNEEIPDKYSNQVESIVNKNEEIPLITDKKSIIIRRNKIIILSSLVIMIGLTFFFLFKRENSNIQEEKIKENEPLISVSENANKDVIINNNVKKSYWVVTEKSNFYEYADISTQKKAYLVKGQILEGCCEQNNFIYCKYINKNGQVTEGWLLTNTLSESDIEQNDKFFKGNRQFCNSDNICYDVSIINNKIIVFNTNDKSKIIEGTITDGKIENTISHQLGLLDFNFQDSNSLIFIYEDDYSEILYQKN